jgi:hypothetical protein
MEIRVRSTGAVMLEEEFRRYVKATSGGSFDALTIEILHENGADPVLEGPQANPTRYQMSFRDGVQEINGQWFTKYSVVDLTDEQKAAKDADQAKAVRDDRNKRLAECDWTQLSDAPVDKTAWASYRQELRDISKQTGFPWEVTWPTAP